MMLGTAPPCVCTLASPHLRVARRRAGEAHAVIGCKCLVSVEAACIRVVGEVDAAGLALLLARVMHVAEGERMRWTGIAGG